MKTVFLASLLAAAISVSTASLCAQQGAQKAAQEAAQSWLALVDAGQYRESWSQAAPLFKERITMEKWESALQSVRTPLGKAGSRNLSSATYAKSLPSAPDGEYVVIQYKTSFEKKKSAVETVTPMKGDDGQWRVSGYYIK